MGQGVRLLALWNDVRAESRDIYPVFCAHFFPVDEQGARQCLSDRCLVHFALIEGVTTMA